ncbi:hypothetical protein [Providencia sp.]|uniref:hypothetical protein n=1 Tax=Providencia sp. TaxID=589 RepID=UPI003340027A
MEFKLSSVFADFSSKKQTKRSYSDRVKFAIITRTLCDIPAHLTFEAPHVMPISYPPDGQSACLYAFSPLHK